MSANPTILGEILRFWDGNWWWLIWVVPGMIAGAFDWVRDFVISVIDHRARAAKVRHKAEVKALRRALAEVNTGKPPTVLLSDPKPGKCVHRNVVPVVSDERTIAWLCRTCDAQLPADWAVRAEDL